MCLKLLLKEKNEVLIFEPAWLSYEHQIKLANGIPKFIKYDITVNKIEEFVSKKTGVIIINNPNNPSGRVYSRADLEFLKNLCEKKEIFLLVDEAYSDFVVDKSFFSMARLSPKLKNVIIINSLSKNLGLSGWRIGFLIAKEQIINEIVKLNQHLITCAPTILQMYLDKTLIN